VTPDSGFRRNDGAVVVPKAGTQEVKDWMSAFSGMTG